MDPFVHFDKYIALYIFCRLLHVQYQYSKDTINKFKNLFEKLLKEMEDFLKEDVIDITKTSKTITALVLLIISYI